MHSTIIDLQIRKMLWRFTHERLILKSQRNLWSAIPSFISDRFRKHSICQMSKQYPRYCIEMRWNFDWNASILLTRKLHYKIRRTNKSLYLIRLIFHHFIGCRNLFSESISIKNYIDEALALWILCILRLSRGRFSELSNLSIWLQQYFFGNFSCSNLS